MAKYAHAEVLDGGLNAIRNNATQMLLLKAYAPGDNYATVSGNTICAVRPLSGLAYRVHGRNGESPPGNG
jgi:hypothetical protein